MKQNLLIFLSVILFATACSQQTGKTVATEEDNDSLATILEGDSTIYGIVCDGCTDTILVFLSSNNIAADPDTLNILDATRNHRIFGRLTIGDKIAVVRNDSDSTIAKTVIDMENLFNTWCYQALPKLHVRADMEGRTEQQKINNLPDSIRNLLSIPREYTLQIKADHSAMAYGNMRKTTDEDDIIEYPTIKRYGQWHLFNGKLLLTEMAIDSTGAMNAISIDTVQFVLLDRDTLVLQFADELRSYYKKVKSEE